MRRPLLGHLFKMINLKYIALLKIIYKLYFWSLIRMQHLLPIESETTWSGPISNHVISSGQEEWRKHSFLHVSGREPVTLINIPNDWPFMTSINWKTSKVANKSLASVVVNCSLLQTRGFSVFSSTERWCCQGGLVQIGCRKMQTSRLFSKEQNVNYYCAILKILHI